MIEFNKIPGIENKVSLLDYQGELVFLMRFLLKKGYATKVGAYNGHAPIPLFKHHENGKYAVESITKKTGYKLLDGIKLKQLAKLNTLASWLISKFPLIQEAAEKHYGEKLDSEKNQPQIIAAAAHYLQQQENKNSPSQENLIFGISSVAIVFLAIYIYSKHTDTVFQVLSIALLIAGCVSLVSLLVLKAAENLQAEYFKLGLATTLFCFFLGVYQRILLTLDWNGRFAATFIIVPIIILLIFRALYLLSFALSRKSEQDSVVFMLYETLDQVKTNLFRLNEVIILFTMASIGLLVMANFSVFWRSFDYIVK